MSQLTQEAFTAGLRADEDGDFAELQLGFLDHREVLDFQLAHCRPPFFTKQPNAGPSTPLKNASLRMTAPFAQDDRPFC
jgi:hypothetical protein